MHLWIFAPFLINCERVILLVLFGFFYFSGGVRRAIYWISNEEWYQTSQWAKGLDFFGAFICAYICIEVLTNGWRRKTIQIREQEHTDKEKKKKEAEN